jgi:hypothetical protein
MRLSACACSGPPAQPISVGAATPTEHVLGIYKALHILLPNDAAADSWVNRPNTHPLFAGGTPMQRLQGGLVADLFVVRQYLDAERGWN